jgi:hypothetical protein
LDQAPLRGATLFIFSLIHLAQCACKIALARLNLATAVQAVGVKAPGRSLNGGDGGGDGGDAEEERRTPPGDSGSS